MTARAVGGVENIGRPIVSLGGSGRRVSGELVGPVEGGAETGCGSCKGKAHPVSAGGGEPEAGDRPSRLSERLVEVMRGYNGVANWILLYWMGERCQERRGWGVRGGYPPVGFGFQKTTTRRVGELEGEISR